MVRQREVRVSETNASVGAMGELQLAAGERIGLRLWDEEPTRIAKDVTARDYETVGYVIEGRAVLMLRNERIELKAGDSWLVPAGAEHSYQVLEHFRSVEATSPPAQRGELAALNRSAEVPYSRDDVLA